jgi:hypothetical protein
MAPEEKQTGYVFSLAVPYLKNSFCFCLPPQPLAYHLTLALSVFKRLAIKKISHYLQFLVTQIMVGYGAL